MTPFFTDKTLLAIVLLAMDSGLIGGGAMAVDGAGYDISLVKA